MGENGVKYFPFKAGLGNIETILENYHRTVTMNNNSDVNDCLEYIIRNFKQKMIIVLVSDVRGFTTITDTNLKRLLVAHDVLALNISDASINGNLAYNMNAGTFMPAFLSKNKKLQRAMKEANLKLQKTVTERLKKFGISCSTIDYVEELDREIVDLLAKHRGEKLR